MTTHTLSTCGASCVDGQGVVAAATSGRAALESRQGVDQDKVSITAVPLEMSPPPEWHDGGGSGPCDSPPLCRIDTGDGAHLPV